MIKGKLKSIEQFLKEGGKFDKNGDLIKSDGGEISSNDFHLLGTIQENIELESSNEEGNLFEVFRYRVRLVRIYLVFLFFAPL